MEFQTHSQTSSIKITQHHATEHLGKEEESNTQNMN